MTTLNELVPAVLERLKRTQTEVLDGGFPRTAAGEPILPRGQYLVVYTDSPRLSAGALSADFRRQMLGFRVVCVGRNAGEARDAASWALSRLARWSPTPEDQTRGRLAPVPDGAPILPDQSVPGDVRYSQTLAFTVATSRS